jgi:hypothetical protein
MVRRVAALSPAFAVASILPSTLCEFSLMTLPQLHLPFSYSKTKEPKSLRCLMFNNLPRPIQQEAAKPEAWFCSAWITFPGSRAKSKIPELSTACLTELRGVEWLAEGAQLTNSWSRIRPASRRVFPPHHLLTGLSPGPLAVTLRRAGGGEAWQVSPNGSLRPGRGKGQGPGWRLGREEMPS